MKIFQVGVDETTLAFLNGKGFSVTTDDVEGPEDLEEYLSFGAYETIVINLDKTMWGVFAVRYLRSKGILTPVVAMTTGNEEDSWSEQRALFLENGGDDLLRTPVNPRELAATLRAGSRRGKGLIIDIREFKHGEALVRINLSLQTVMVNSEYVHLTGKEMGILSMLASNRNRTQSKEMLLSALYTAIEDEPEIKIIDVFICKLRAKLSAVHPDAGKTIETVWGRGYQMCLPHAEPELQTSMG
jgi:two-component system, cell cycle response regulator CtrA